MTLWGQTVSWLEAVAFVTGLLCVWGMKRMRLWNWPMGLLNVACFAVLFLQARLYADALLQVLFALLGVMGWWQWARALRQMRGITHTPPVTRTAPVEATISVGLCVLAVAAGAHALARYTDSPAPAADMFILVFSLLATAAQAVRRLESWWVWIAVDIVSVPLYWQRGLPLTALLYLIFLGLCIGGLREWRRHWQTQQHVTPDRHGHESTQ